MPSKRLKDRAEKQIKFIRQYMDEHHTDILMLDDVAKNVHFK